MPLTRRDTQKYYSTLLKAVRPLVNAGLSVPEIVIELNKREIPSSRGRKWTPALLYWTFANRLGISTCTYTRHYPSRARRIGHE